MYSRDGNRLVRLAPEFVGAASVSSREKQPWFFVTMSGFNSPGTIARYDFTTAEEQRWNIYRSVKVGSLNPGDFDTRQASFPIS